LKPRIGMLDWNWKRIECYLSKIKKCHCILYYAKFLEWPAHYAICKITGLDYINCAYHTKAPSQVMDPFSIPNNLSLI